MYPPAKFRLRNELILKPSKYEMTFFFKTVFRAPQSHELGIGIGLRLGLGLGQGCGARKTKLKKMAISMYLVLDREFISKRNSGVPFAVSRTPWQYLCPIYGRDLPTSTTYCTSSVIAGMRGAKAGVSPPRRSPPCVPVFIKQGS